MKLCTVVPDLNTHGGVAYVSRKILNSLTKKGANCHVITTENTDPEIPSPVDNRVKQHHLNESDMTFPKFGMNRRPFTVGAARTLASVAASHEFDAIYAPGFILSSVLLAESLPWSPVSRSTPIIGSSHGTYVDFFKQTNSIPSFSGKIPYIAKLYADHLLTKTVFRRADLVHAVSTNTGQELSELGINEEEIITVPNAIDVEDLSAKQPTDVRTKYGYDKEKIILSVGTLEPRKGIHLILNAIPTIDQTFSDILVVIAGPQPYTGYNNYLTKQVKALDIDGEVIFTGKIARSELLGWYNASDVVVSASYSEGGPMSILEAAASATDVVTTDVGCMREVLGDLGIYISAGQPKSVATGIQKGIEAENGSEIQDHIRRTATWANRADDLYTLFKSAAKLDS